MPDQGAEQGPENNAQAQRPPTPQYKEFFSYSINRVQKKTNHCTVGHSNKEMFEGTGLDQLWKICTWVSFTLQKLKRHMSVTGVFSPGHPCELPVKKYLRQQGDVWEDGGKFAVAPGNDPSPPNFDGSVVAPVENDWLAPALTKDTMAHSPGLVGSSLYHGINLILASPFPRAGPFEPGDNLP